MERGVERGSAITVLSIISIVGVVASLTLFTRAPTGLIMQGQGVYPTEDARSRGLICGNPENKMFFLGYNANYEVWCCMEDMIGQNECKFPHKVLITA